MDELYRQLNQTSIGSVTTISNTVDNSFFTKILLDDAVQEEEKLKLLLECNDSEELALFLAGRGEKRAKLFKLYMSKFNFSSLDISEALRSFASKFHIAGESQQVERILHQFSERFYESNPTAFCSVDHVNILTNAIVMLNTDLHNLNNPFKMTRNVFVDRVKQLVDIDDVILKEIYSSIKAKEIKLQGKDEEVKSRTNLTTQRSCSPTVMSTKSLPISSSAQDSMQESLLFFNEGNLKRKSVMLSHSTKSSSRSWKEFFACLTNSSFKFYKPIKNISSKGKLIDEVCILHALASPFEYKRPNVFSVRSSEGGFFLFECDSFDIMQKWMDSINWVAAIYSSKPLPMAASSDALQFRPPRMPKYTQLTIYPTPVIILERKRWLEQSVAEMKQTLFALLEKGIQSEVEEEMLNYYNWQIKKYSTYIETISLRINNQSE